MKLFKIGLCVAFVASAFMVVGIAQGKKADKGTKTSNIEGKVGKVDKDSITVLVNNAPRPIMFSTSTKFMMGHTTDNKPGKVSEIKKDYYISCSGDVNDKNEFMAKECLYRDKQ